jgi:hypothetical protein
VAGQNVGAESFGMLRRIAVAALVTAVQSVMSSTDVDKLHNALQGWSRGERSFEPK